MTAGHCSPCHSVSIPLAHFFSPFLHSLVSNYKCVRWMYSSDHWNVHLSIYSVTFTYLLRTSITQSNPKVYFFTMPLVRQVSINPLLLVKHLFSKDFILGQSIDRQ